MRVFTVRDIYQKAPGALYLTEGDKEVNIVRLACHNNLVADWENSKDRSLHAT